MPLMPGAVFLLAASICYLRGSSRLHRWLVTHPVLGRHVQMATGDLAMPLRAKVTALGAMWIAVSVSLFATPHLVTRLVLVVLAAIGTWFILARR